MMKYMGSKSRIAKHILPIILKNRKDSQYYVEPFVGGANMIDKVEGLRIGADNNKYLIAMWKALQQGWIPPEVIEREFYNKCRESYNKNNANKEVWHIIGYVGFNGSYGGRFYDGGYAGITTTKGGKERNYPLESYKNVIKQINYIRNIEFNCNCYKDLKIPAGSKIYCDIPYLGAKEYKSASDFNHEDFWQWCRDMSSKGFEVFISEYNAPDDFECIWEKEVKCHLKRESSAIKKTEKLFKYKNV